MRSFTKTSAKNAQVELCSIPLSKLKIGARLQFPMYDARNVLLLKAGTVLNPVQIDRLRRRGLTAVQVSVTEANQWDRTQRSRQGASGTSSSAPEVVRTPVPQPARREAKPRPAPRPRPTGAHSTERMQNVQSELAQTSEALNNLITEMIRSPGSDLGCVREIAGQTVSIVADDPDLAIFSMLLNGGREYPTSHCQRVSILATAMGAAAGLQESELRDLATGCMLHDTGMLLLKEPLYLYPRALTESEIVELKRHPSLVFDVLSNSPAISARAALVAYQVHERDDGSGYPRGRRGDQIHPLSKIAAVADSYIAKISDRPYRPAMSPYRAMEVMLVETGRRQFDPRAVRALLKAESLFPVGSTVELSTGETAQVIRSTPEDYMHPVVSVLSGGPPRIVNLAEERDISIVTESRTETSALAEEVALSCENDADDLDGLSAECAALEFQEEADGGAVGPDDGGPFEDESDAPQE